MHIIPEYNTTSDEVTYLGALVTAFDALLILEGCRLGIIPEIKRRLTSHQRDNIVPYMIYAWDETACGMKRWTDGKNWLASRVQGPFLTYRELDSERNTKSNGLIKQSFSVTTKQNHRLHVIAYAVPMAEPQTSQLKHSNLLQLPLPPLLTSPLSSNPCGIAVPPYVKVPSRDPMFAGITPAPDIYPENVLQMSGPGTVTQVNMQFHHPPHAYHLPRQPPLIYQPPPVRWYPMHYQIEAPVDPQVLSSNPTGLHATFPSYVQQPMVPPPPTPPPPPSVAPLVSSSTSTSTSAPSAAALPKLSNIHGLLQYGPGRPISSKNRPDHDESALKALDKSFTNTLKK